MTNNFCSPSITYQWIKNNNTAIQFGTEPNILPFYSLRLSDAGLYTCYASIGLLSLSNDIVIVMASHEVRIQSELVLIYHESCHKRVKYQSFGYHNDNRKPDN